MGLLDLPSELRYTIYTFWFAGCTYRSAKTLRISTHRYGLYGETWLSDAFVICKHIGYDPWLTDAILKTSTFRVKDADDLVHLRDRFGDAALQSITRIQLGPSMVCDTQLLQLKCLMPKLTRVCLSGCLSPLWRVWDWRLDGFDTHLWSRYIACLCIFAPGRVPGPSSAVAEQALAGDIELVVDFVWHDPDFGRRKMRFSTSDWLVVYEFAGKRVRVSQVRPEELPAVLDRDSESGSRSESGGFSGLR